MAGYSGTPLAKKLGIKENHGVCLINAPTGFQDTLDGLADGVEFLDKPAKDMDVIVFFTDSRAVLEKRFEPLSKRLAPAGGLWISWPKKSSGVPTDLTEDAIRAIGLDVGLVDNKVCAVDETWSGLRFVIRVKDRPQVS